MKTVETREIEKRLMWSYNKMNTFACLEVGIVFKVRRPHKRYPQYIVTRHETEICDFMTYEQDKDVFRCFEIKVSKSDFHSKAKKTFVGNYNYYVMPKSLYLEVKDEIPSNIGVLDEYCNCLKKPKRVSLRYKKNKLLISMLKSLSRENYKRFYEDLRKQIR